MNRIIVCREKCVCVWDNRETAGPGEQEEAGLGEKWSQMEGDDWRPPITQTEERDPSTFLHYMLISVQKKGQGEREFIPSLLWVRETGWIQSSVFLSNVFMFILEFPFLCW